MGLRVSQRRGNVPTPLTHVEHEAIGGRPGCPTFCQGKGGGHSHRWYVPEDYLLEECQAERVRLQDLRPWVQRSDCKRIYARRWGFTL